MKNINYTKFKKDGKKKSVKKVALGIPIFSKSFNRDLSKLKVFLVDWDRITRRLDPVLGIGVIVSQNTACRSMANPNMAEYK